MTNNLKESLQKSRVQKRIMYFVLIALTTLLFVSDFQLSVEDFQNLLRGVWPSLLVVLMVSLWYDYIVKSENLLEDKIIQEELESEIKRKVEDLVKLELKERLTDFMAYPQSECYVFKLIGKRFIKDENLLEKYIDFSSEQLFDQPIYYNLVTKYFLSSIPDRQDYYRWDRIEQFGYELKKRTFIMAISDDTEILNLLLSKFSELDYVIGVSNLEDCPLEEIFDSTQLFVYEPKQSASSPSVPKKLVASQYLKTILKTYEIREPEASRVGLIEFDLSDKNFTLLNFELRQRLIMRTDDQYCSWFADRLTFLKRIEFDYRDFPKENTTDFNVQHFFSSPLSRAFHNEEMRVAYIDYNGWVIKGQGSVLAWRNTS